MSENIYFVTGTKEFSLSELPGSIAITKAQHRALLDGLDAGQVIEQVEGYPALVTPAPKIPSSAELCEQIDVAADAARRAVAGDPLRAVEYDRTAAEAQAFSDAGYQGDVPPMVAAWAISGRTPQQAAEIILAEAAEYTNALIQLRTIRLQAKELIRAAMASGEVEQAKQIVTETVAAIQSAVAGVGNNA